MFKDKSESFDENWDFINNVVFAENHPDLDKEFKGHLWVKELFLNSQYNTVKMSLPINIARAIIIAAEYMVAEMIDNKLKMRKMEQIVS